MLGLLHCENIPGTICGTNNGTLFIESMKAQVALYQELSDKGSRDDSEFYLTNAYILHSA